MPGHVDLRPSRLAAWRTSNRVTTQLIERLPPELWEVSVPEAPRRTIRALAAHLQNARCMWLKTLGREHGIATAPGVDRQGLTPRQLGAALKRSGSGVATGLTLRSVALRARGSARARTAR
jgi:hypothetical protein